MSEAELAETKRRMTALEKTVIDLQEDRRQRGYMLAYALAAVLLTLTFTFVWTGQVNRRTERKFCAIIAASVPADAPPPSSERSARVAGLMRDLGRQLSCPVRSTSVDQPTRR